MYVKWYNGIQFLCNAQKLHNSYKIAELEETYNIFNQ